MDGITLPFPENFSNWVGGSQYFPDMTMSDYEDYLSKNNDKKSAKERKNLYESRHVSDIEYNNISDCLRFCYVRGKVVPQTRIGEKPYNVWVCLNTSNANGCVQTGECTWLPCWTRGKLEACLCFITLYWVWSTSIPQQWGKKTNKRKKIRTPSLEKVLSISWQQHPKESNVQNIHISTGEIC